MPLKRLHLEDKQELVELIRKNCALIDDDLELLDKDFGAEEYPRVDLLARNREGGALFIFADVRADVSGAVNAAAQVDWFMHNRGLMKRLFPSLKIDETAPPRAALIYPEFPLLMKRFVRAALPSSTLLLFQYRCFEALGQRYLYLERSDLVEEKGVRASEKGRESWPPFRRGVAGEDIEITREEREAFLS